MRPKICKNLRTANLNPKFTGYQKKSAVDIRDVEAEAGSGGSG